MRPPTEVQTAIAGFLAAFSEKQGMPPTKADIADHFKYRSANAAVEHLKAMEVKGLVTLKRGISRGVQLTAAGHLLAEASTVDVDAIRERAAQACVRKNNAKRQEEIDCRAQTEWGVDAESVEYIRANDVHGAYEKQMANARKRGIAWLFTRATWWRVWLDSGKWEQRGTSSRQYVMARHLDLGPYAPWNVSIKTASENAIEREPNRRARNSHSEHTADVMSGNEQEQA